MVAYLMIFILKFNLKNCIMKTTIKKSVEVSAYCMSMIIFTISLVLMFAVTANITFTNIVIYVLMSVLAIWGVIKLHLMHEPKRKMIVALIGSIILLVISILSILPISEGWGVALCILMALPYSRAVEASEIELGIVFVTVLVVAMVIL